METVDLTNDELTSDVIYLPDLDQYAFIINDRVYRLTDEQATTLHNQFVSAVTAKLLLKLGEWLIWQPN